ncbi:uncharacterized protein KQ657_003754 [Scheffersomyces spartinae]|uniref:Seipin n=1 Tax=Scheffersomyces spartinae TaxID=45513 RepID=A0A9P7VCD8_9ASCO|nr:uncharacterized protein KQ657_003754 [Scheffersomyces spartinae]KAG7195228.1 hypothetical protein KQ657_003754 [Scheffersomyces spartinae]
MFIVSALLNAIKGTLLHSRKPILYTITTWVYVVVVFPLAVAAYLYFYQILIPNSPQEVVLINEISSITQLSTIKKEVFYDLLLRLNLWCFDSAQYLAHYSLQSESGPQLQSSVLVNCDWKNVYKHNNPYIPYALRWLVFPKWINWDKTYSLLVPVARGVRGSFLKQTALELIIDESVKESYSTSSYLMLDVAWRGMRYYMYHYYFLSLIIGSVVFYAVCTLVMLVSSFIMNVIATLQRDSKKVN